MPITYVAHFIPPSYTQNHYQLRGGTLGAISFGVRVASDSPQYFKEEASSVSRRNVSEIVESQGTNANMNTNA